VFGVMIPRLNGCIPTKRDGFLLLFEGSQQTKKRPMIPLPPIQVFLKICSMLQGSSSALAEYELPFCQTPLTGYPGLFPLWFTNHVHFPTPSSSLLLLSSPPLPSFSHCSLLSSVMPPLSSIILGVQGIFGILNGAASLLFPAAAAKNLQTLGLGVDALPAIHAIALGSVAIGFVSLPAFFSHSIPLSETSQFEQ